MKDIIDAFTRNSGIPVLDGCDWFTVACYLNPEKQTTSPAAASMFVYVESIEFNSSLMNSQNWTLLKKLRVLLHEIAHASGHSSRLGRKAITISNYQLTTYDLAVEELIAEKASKLLLESLGYNTVELTDDYSAYATKQMYYILPLIGDTTELLYHIDHAARIAHDYVMKHWLHDLNIQEKIA